ncbi:glucosaminidase domain-containing protein [Flexithrix dorotheae]|uniref:glucosaminidase domain-containing protein n=1 Tax=Flexithrix dorotheae TaxID=70993 RepID=UPI0003A4932C|nr:glucosaminidase domain-containing protein [Flexithrix dorotheae]
MNILIYLLIFIVKLLFPKYWNLPVKVVYAQAALETGWFTSGVFKENNNLFGMRHPSQRKTTSKGVGRGEDQHGQAIYGSWWASIYDYFLRQEYFKVDYQNIDQYIRKTKSSGYATSNSYTSSWRGLINQVPGYYSFLPWIPATILLYILIADKKKLRLKNVFR